MGSKISTTRKSLRQVPSMVLFFLGLSLQNMGSQFPYQGSHPDPLQWKHSLNSWTTREVPHPQF